MLKTKLREYRAKHNMNQETLAGLVGVRRETIGHLERGNYSPSLKLAWDISKIFNVTIEELFEYVEEE
ncbi:helix-turn-helix transcriptional regulator [Neobacillus sp. FSL H8-0543]|uniref:helix-turn-helix transcriptional regulator n=1 Tax=Neobacillus sp. FSL H8-0543 TaxID=2954672 RepID=UPI003158EA6C